MALTNEEIALVNKLGDCWNDFLLLPTEHPMANIEFCTGVHVLQDKILARSGIREMNDVKTTTP
jgi:hypothetical protein